MNGQFQSELPILKTNRKNSNFGNSEKMKLVTDIFIQKDKKDDNNDG